MADYQSIFTGQEVDRAVQKLQNWAHAGFTHPTTGTDSSDAYDNITISGQTYAVLWRIEPTSSNTVYGIGLDTTSGRIYQIKNTQGVYTATALDANSDTKNTAGATNSTSKLFIIGAGSQTANPQTYSNANVYEENGILYSESEPVALKGKPIVEVESYAAVPDNELGLYKYDEVIAGGTKTSHIVEVTKEEYAGSSGETFEKTTTTNNSQLSTSTFYNHFDSGLQDYLLISSVTNVYALYYNMPFNGIRLGTGSATGSISFSLASPCEITIYKYFGYNGSTGEITSYDGASKVVADGVDYTFTADDEPVVLELSAGQHTISSFHITDPKTAGRVIITSFEFEGGGSRVVYTKHEIARVEEVTALDTKVESYNTTLTNRLVSDEHNIQTNTNNITDLGEKLGDVQIFNYSSLPQPSIDYINKIARVDDVLYQCVQVGDGVLKNFAFNVNGTSEITDLNKSSFISDVGNRFSNFYDITGLSRVYRNNGNIKLGSSNNTGAIGFEKKSGVDDVTSLVIGVMGYGNYGSTFYIEDDNGAVGHYFISDSVSETLIDITDLAGYEGQLNNLYISTEATHDNDEVNDKRGIITRLIVGFGDIEYEWQELGEADFQPLDADLTAIAGISDSSTGYLRKTDANTWSLANPTTSGSSNSTAKLYLVGAGSQSSNGVVTYSNANVYEENGKLYSNGQEVLTGHQNEYGKIKVGDTTTTADSIQDTITFAKSGDLTVNISGDTITYGYTTPSSLKNPNKLNIKANSDTANLIEYDGSAAKTLTVKPSSTDGAFELTDGTTTKTIQLAGTFTDTKNTAGTTNSANTKLFLVGAGSQGANPQTYSNSGNYIGTDNCLYSNNVKVLTSHAAEYGKIKVSGGEAKTADSAQDTIEFAAGGNLSVARDGDKITYSYTTPSSLKNPNKLNLKVNSETSNFVEYDGSATKTVTLKPSSTDGALIVSDGTTDKTIQLAGVFTDTKNTAGSSNSTDKLFVIGAGSQAANPQTYSNSKVYIQNNKLYSNEAEVLTAHASRTINSGKKADGSTDITGSASTGNLTLGDSGITAGTYKRVQVNAKGIVVGGDQVDTDTDTWRKVQLNGVDKLGTATTTNPLNIKAGDNMTITESGGTFTFASSYTDTKNTAGSTNSTSKLFLVGAGSQGNNPQTYSYVNLYTDSGTLYTPNINVSGNITDGTNTVTVATIATTSDIEDIREVAEGKTATYVANITTNPSLNSQNASIEITSFTDISGNTHNTTDVKVGDVIYVTDTEVPDRWVSSLANSKLTCLILETAKVPITSISLNSSAITPVNGNVNIEVPLNQAGSTNSADKLYLVGAGSQAAHVQTYSNSSVYTQNGAIYAKGGNINTDTNNAPFYISRSGSTAEAVAHSVDDSIFHIDYTNDEAAANIKWQIINTDQERAENKGADASTHYMQLSATKAAATLTIDGVAVSMNGHTHNYAGSSSAGGKANSAAVADKLNTDAGSATQPVYFSNGVPVATTYSLSKSVPSDAVFTDTKNTAGATDGSPTGDGKLYLIGAGAQTANPQTYTDSKVYIGAGDKLYSNGKEVVVTDDSRLSDARTPTSHASSATTYGIGTTSNYGHVKLATGDMNGATNTDGVAVSKNHTHSQYLLTANYVDTKNTAGSSNSTDKLFLIGAGSQAANPQTYSNSKVYATNGALYSDSLTLDKADGNIYYQGTQAKYAMIKFKDNTGDTYGNGVVIGGGGAVVIGSGESGDTVWTGAGLNGGTETLYLASDGDIIFKSQVQDGYANAKTMTFSGSNGNLAVPGAITSNGTTVALSNHTHTTSIAADSGTNQLTLAYGTKYKLTAGGSSFIFTMPNGDDTDTKNTAGATNSTSKLFLVGAGSQLANPQTYTHSAVYETAGTLNATKYTVAETATIQYNSTTGCMEIVC